MSGLKSKDIIAKLGFNRIQNELFQLIEGQDDQSCQQLRTEVRAKLSTPNNAMECLVHACDQLGEQYSHWHEVDKQTALAVEIEGIENASLEIEQALNAWLVNNINIKSVTVTEQLKLEIKVHHKMW